MFDQNPHFSGTRRQLENYPNSTQSRQLLDRMNAHCISNPAYRWDFDAWLTQGGTIRLRDLCAPFGDHANDLSFQNLVDTLDSAHLHRFDTSALN